MMPLSFALGGGVDEVGDNEQILKDNNWNLKLIFFSVKHSQPYICEIVKSLLDYRKNYF